MSFIPIGHFTHHKCGNVWFKDIFLDLSKNLGWKFYLDQKSPEAFIADPHMKIWMDGNSVTSPDTLGTPTQATHMIRDPRDVLVSGYHYHRWCPEEWVKKPIKNFLKHTIPSDIEFLEDETVQEALLRLPLVEGLRVELEINLRYCGRLRSWNFQQPNVLELKYEEIYHDFNPEVYEAFFERIALHYRLDGRYRDLFLKATEAFRFDRKTGRSVGQVKEKNHHRKATAGQWRELPKSVLEEFRLRNGDLLISLGYESSDNWI